MGQGEYKIGVVIEVTYQAVNLGTGKTVTMDVYDEAHAKDVAKCVAAMSEIVVTGRYYAAFTPDAEGIWTVVMLNTTDSNGPVVKQYAVAGHNIDGVGDSVVTAIADIATVDGKVDGVATDRAALEILSATDVAGELATYDGPTKAEMDAGFTAIGSPAMVG